MNIQEPSYFDLNIGEILEAWQVRHAVREVIANALDEQALTQTSNVLITKTVDGWLIRDQGRGLRYEHLRQDENDEKLSNASKVIGKFGLGLKDALATFHRHGVAVRILSKHSDITVTERPKHGFAKMPTLHAVIRPPTDPQRVGTDVHLSGLDDAEMTAAMGFFLRFSGEEVLGQTPHGEILRRVEGRPSRVYVKGLLVAEEEAFACSYNIISLTAAMGKALNRERTNVGRTAYVDRVKSMLLACNAPAVFEILAAEIGRLDKGTAHDEVKWMDVAVHACKILNQSKKVVFVSSQELEDSPNMVDQARSDGYRLITLPHNIRVKLRGLCDSAGAPMRGLDVFTKEWMDSFEFEFVEESRLTPAEHAIFAHRDEIAALAGGWPKVVRETRVSTTMRPDSDGRTDHTSGLWEPENGRIVVKRDQLRSAKTFAGTLLHEIIHARTGYGDVSRSFESALTDLVGHLASNALSAAPVAPHPVFPSARSAPARVASSLSTSRGAAELARAKAASSRSSKPTPKAPAKGKPRPKTPAKGKPKRKTPAEGKATLKRP